MSLSLRGERLQARIVFEKTLERLHEGRAAAMLQIDDRQIVLGHAELFQALVHTRAGLPRHGEHVPVNFVPLRTRAAQGFPPRSDGKRRLRRGNPDDPLFERDFVKIGFEKPRTAEILHRFGNRHPGADLCRAREGSRAAIEAAPIRGPGLCAGLSP